ncbi:MAG: N-acetylmuramoyl-L-alanine amidase [Kovacikia sp.]
MKRLSPLLPLSYFLLPLGVVLLSSPIEAAQPLHLTYPPANHQTTANQIFLIGTAPPQGTVLVNDKPISRSPAGHFAPSFPLKMGENQFTLRYGKQTVKLTVIRLTGEPELPVGLTFAKDSLSPAVDIAKLPNEPICFGAIAPANANVTVKLAGQLVPLLPQTQQIDLPENSAVLTAKNEPTALSASRYQACAQTVLLGDLGKPEFSLTLDGKSISQTGPGSIRILSPTQLEIAEVIVDSGAARTGPSTDYSRLTPLPKATRAAITGYEGDWVRLDYGGWINRKEVQIQTSAVPLISLIRSIKATQVDDWTEVVFPLQVPVPISVQQGDRTFTLTLYNTTAQTDIIKLDDEPLIARLDWQQIAPKQVQYTFHLKTDQQWGYQLRYEGTSLVLSLRHPPGRMQQGKGTSIQNPKSKIQNVLSGIKILLDPGHGGPEDLGARGPTGYPEKAVALKISQLVQEQLVQRGATVYMTREKDTDVSLKARIDLISKLQPTLALSLHYNALPDNGDAIKTQGVAAFWYNAQAHSLAVFLHNYLVKTLNRPSYGIFWNNLALTRPTVAPAVLMELGFMINPNEYEWIVNPTEQKKLAGAIADGITEWLKVSQTK